MLKHHCPLPLAIPALLRNAGAQGFTHAEIGIALQAFYARWHDIKGGRRKDVLRMRDQKYYQKLRLVEEISTSGGEEPRFIRRFGIDASLNSDQWIYDNLMPPNPDVDDGSKGDYGLPDDINMISNVVVVMVDEARHARANASMRTSVDTLSKIWMRSFDRARSRQIILPEQEDLLLLLLLRDHDHLLYEMPISSARVLDPLRVARLVASTRTTTETARQILDCTPTAIMTIVADSLAALVGRHRLWSDWRSPRPSIDFRLTLLCHTNSSLMDYLAPMGRLRTVEERDQRIELYCMHLRVNVLIARCSIESALHTDTTEVSTTLDVRLTKLFGAMTLSQVSEADSDQGGDCIETPNAEKMVEGLMYLLKKSLQRECDKSHCEKYSYNNPC
jgi:hypothetical protein